MQPAIVSFAFSVIFCAHAQCQTDLEKAENLATCLRGEYPTLCHMEWLSVDDRKKALDAEREKNLATCLSGNYSSLCNKALLNSEERLEVAAAEKRANLKTCLTGQYPTLCDKSILTSSELSDVNTAETAENLRTCLLGRFQRLCDHAKLSPLQASQVKVAEDNYEKFKQQHPNVATRSGTNNCESGHWVQSVSEDGDIIKLEDGSIWEVNDVDAVDSALWLPTTEITVCNGKLINTDDNEKVSAKRIK